MNRLLIALLVVLGIGGIIAANAFFIVRETEQALVLRFGETQGAPITEPGIYMKLPFIDAVEYIDRRLRVLDEAPREINVADRKRFIVDAFMRYQIVDPQLFYRTLRTLPRAEGRLSELFDASLRGILASKDLNAVLSEERVAVMGEIRDDMRAKAEELGIDVIDVRIKRADLPQENSDAIFRRMRTERQREAAEFRAIGEEQARRIRAEADREVTVILAEARRESEIIRGDGDAERNRIFAEAFSRDPEFFAFYRSMQAYQRALGADNTSMVLSPSSAFFRYFETDGGGGAAN